MLHFGFLPIDARRVRGDALRIPQGEPVIKGMAQDMNKSITRMVAPDDSSSRKFAI